MEFIDYEDFAKLDIRTARILNVEDVEGSKKLYKMVLEVGTEKRVVVAGIKESYSKEELIGKTVILLYNLKPKKILGIESQGMLLAVGDKEIALLTTDKEVPSGLRVS